MHNAGRWQHDWITRQTDTICICARCGPAQKLAFVLYQYQSERMAAELLCVPIECAYSEWSVECSDTVARVRRYGAQRFDSRKIDACVGQSLTGGLCRSIRAGVRTRVVRTTAVKRDWGAKCMWVCVFCAVFLLFVLGSSCSHWPTGYRPTINNINVECVCEFAHEAYRNRDEHPRSDLHALLLILLVSV